MTETTNKKSMAPKRQPSTNGKELPMESSDKKRENTGKGNATHEMSIESLPISALVVTENHPRKGLRELESLTGSIRRDGLQEPLQVYPLEEDKFGIIDGTRRLEALRAIECEQVPCIVTEVPEPDAIHLSYVRNVERDALDPIEIALHIQKMKAHFGFTHRDLEVKGYGSPTAITFKLKLLQLPDSIQEELRTGKLTESHGLALLKLPSQEEQERMAKQITTHKLSTERTKSRISQYNRRRRGKVKRNGIPIQTSDIPGVFIKDSRDMSELPDKTAHMILSSPPYGAGMEFEEELSFPELMDMIRGVLDECARVLIPGGTMALNVGNIQSFRGQDGKAKNIQVELMGHRYQAHLRKHQIFLSDIIIWKKPLPWSKRPRWRL